MKISEAYEVLLERFIEIRGKKHYNVYLCIEAKHLKRNNKITESCYDAIISDIQSHIVEKSGDYEGTMGDCVSKKICGLPYEEFCDKVNTYRMRFIKSKIKFYKQLEMRVDNVI